MKYAEVLDCDVVNGKRVGISLFVQGCPKPHCEGCFNSQAWDFKGGEDLSDEKLSHFYQMIDRPYIKRISILGGEPLCKQNIHKVTDIVKKCKEKFPEKEVWVWTRYNFEMDISSKEIAQYADYIVDGEFILEQKDLSLAFRGSKNQHIWEKQFDGTWKDKSNEI